MMSLSKERKERRLQSYDGMMMTRRGYNAALCGLLLYGIAANFIICKYFTDAVEALNPTAFLIGYLVCAIIGCLMSGYQLHWLQLSCVALRYVYFYRY